MISGVDININIDMAIHLHTYKNVYMDSQILPLNTVMIQVGKNTPQAVWRCDYRKENNTINCKKKSRDNHWNANESKN